jgi:predicted PurR-regulated permease PerM
MAFTFSSKQKQSALWLSVAFALVLLLVFLGPILMPFVVAAIFAYTLNPLLNKIVTIHIKQWYLPRSVAAGLLILVVILMGLAMILIMLPILQKQLPLLQNQIPQFFEKLDHNLSPLLHELGFNVKIDSSGIKSLITEHLSGSGEMVGKAILSSLKVGGTAVLGLTANLLLIPVVLFYLLVDWNSLIARIKNTIPRRFIAVTISWTEEIDELLAQYLRGQIMVMFSLAIFYSVGLSIVGLNLALPVGILTGLLVFIPYLGFGLGLALAMMSALLQFQEASALISVAIVFGAGQLVESFYLTPKLVGERIGLHPLTVIFALMAFGQLFGFIGILIALPASAILSVMLRHLRASYLSSPFYKQI